jgi:hypothetical protein
MAGSFAPPSGVKCATPPIFRVADRLSVSARARTVRGMRKWVLLTVMAMGGVLTPGADAAGTRDCGLTARIDGARYQVKETRGSLPCATVKRAVTTFLRDDTAPAHWTCFRGHGNQTWAASCARGKTVVVRVYAPT